MSAEAIKRCIELRQSLLKEGHGMYTNKIIAARFGVSYATILRIVKEHEARNR